MISISRTILLFAVIAIFQSCLNNKEETTHTDNRATGDTVGAPFFKQR